MGVARPVFSNMWPRKRIISKRPVLSLGYVGNSDREVQLAHSILSQCPWNVGTVCCVDQAKSPVFIHQSLASCLLGRYFNMFVSGRFNKG